MMIEVIFFLNIELLIVV